MAKPDEILPIGGLNVDAEDRNLPPMDYRYALNFRNGTPYMGKGDAGTNIKGNLAIPTYICPYTGGTFPAGKKKEIGFLEDVVGNTILFFVWAKSGKHGIYRYYPNKTDANNPYGIVEQIISYNFNWKQNERITSVSLVQGTTGNLLYWVDSTGLRKINVDKANICDKQKTWTVVLPNGVDGGTFNFQIVIKNILTAAPIVSQQIDVPAGLTREEILASVATQINAHLSAYITATSCDCHLDITETVVNNYNVIFTLPTFFVIPNNWYGINLIDRFFDRSKWMELYPPLPEYKQNAQSEFNNVKNRVFQFRLRLVYDDLEQSALGEISQLALNNIQCDGIANPLYNYIDVNFNDPALIDANILVLLKKIKFCALEQNTGTWKEVLTLEPCDWLALDGSNVIAHYDFDNNIGGTAIDSTTVARENDGVPLYANAEVEYENRLVTGGVTMGHDGPECPQATLQVNVGDTVVRTWRKITGKIRVLTYGLQDNETFFDPTIKRSFYQMWTSDTWKYPFWEPGYTRSRGGIFHDVSASPNLGPFFGGGGFGAGAGGDFGIRAGMETLYDQRIPEGGWAAFTLGKPFFGISKQVDIGLPVDSDGALDTSTDAQRDAIGRYYYQTSNNDLYSVFEILVPDNDTYVIGLPSHWCSFGDKLQKGHAYDLNGGLNFQNTSTYVHNTYDANGNALNNKEITVTVNGADVDCGTFLVMDLAPPWDARLETIHGLDFWQPIAGYLVDSEGATDINSAGFNGEAVEKTVVQYEKYTNAWPQFLGIPVTVEEANWNGTCITDRNGFWFGIAGGQGYNTYQINSYQVGPAPSFITVIKMNDTKLFLGTVTEYRGKTLNPLVFNAIPDPQVTTEPFDDNGFGLGLVSCFISTETALARADCSTFLEGRVVDANGHGVPGVLVIYENGRVFTTDSTGAYKILIWGDMLTPNLPFYANILSPTSNQDRRVDSLIFSASNLCVVTYTDGQTIGPIDVIPFGANTTDTPPPYSPTAIYPVADFEIDEAGGGVTKTRKRGGKHIIAIRYADLQGRLCSVVKLGEIYLPFETEDLGKFGYVIDNSGNVYPLGTYKGGIPTILWTLAANFKPPVWAATYNFMFTLDTFYSYWLQWVANGVTYLSKTAQGGQPEIQTAYANGDAVAVKISIANIVNYAQLNPTSLVGYTFTAGDRLRLIYDRDLTLLHGMYDFEITSFDIATSSLIVNITVGAIEIKSGFTIEIYRPKSVDTNETQRYYEMGEVYNCTNPNHANNAHSVTSGVFTSGDMFWHGRLIPVNDDATNFSATYPVIIESQSISDFYVSTDTDQGRIGVIDENFKQVYYPSRLVVSDKFEPDTAFNGLSIYEPLNTKDQGRQFGEVQRLVMVGKVLHAIMKNNNISNYIGIVTLQYKGDTGGVNAIADDFLGTNNPSLGNLGTDWPATITQIDGYIYALYELRKTVWRFANDGSTEISRNEYIDQQGKTHTRMVTFFKELCDNGIYDAVGIYDKRYKEYILSAWRKATAYSTFQSKSGGTLVLIFAGDVPVVVDDTVTFYYTDSVTGGILPYTTTITNVLFDGVETLVGLKIDDAVPINLAKSIKMEYRGEGTTIVWNEAKNRWTYEYPVQPDGYATLGDTLFSFDSGGIWIHDTNAIRNNFYGVQYDMQVVPVFNEEPTVNKFWSSLWMYQYQDNKGCNWRSDSITNTNGQQSRLKAVNWKRREQDWYISFKRDLTDLNASNPISNGRVLRSSALKVGLINDYTGEVLVYGWKAFYTNSQLTSK